MPRIRKTLPPARADYSFGDLLYWHLALHGTRPGGDPADAVGREWDPSAFCALLGISDRTLRNWIADRHCPDSAEPIAQELFGNNPRFDPWRLELAEALRRSRQGKPRKSPENTTPETGGKPENAAADADGGDTPPADEHRPDRTGAGTARADQDAGRRSRSTALVPTARSRHDDARADRGITVIHPVWSSAPSPSCARMADGFQERGEVSELQ